MSEQLICAMSVTIIVYAIFIRNNDIETSYMQCLCNTRINLAGILPVTDDQVDLDLPFEPSATGDGQITRGVCSKMERLMEQAGWRNGVCKSGEKVRLAASKNSLTPPPRT